MSRDNTAEVFFFSWYLSGVGQLLGKRFQNRCSFLLLWLYRTDFCWDFSFWSAPLAFWLSGFFSALAGFLPGRASVGRSFFAPEGGVAAGVELESAGWADSADADDGSPRTARCNLDHTGMILRLTG